MPVAVLFRQRATRATYTLVAVGLCDSHCARVDDFAKIIVCTGAKKDLAEGFCRGVTIARVCSSGANQTSERLSFARDVFIVMQRETISA